IFALVLEPLAIAIRSNPNIKGVMAGQQEHKILLYADNILLISSNPQITVPTMCSLIDDFSQISGYKINWSKSEVMPLSKNHNNMLEVQWPFKWVKWLIWVSVSGNQTCTWIRKKICRLTFNQLFKRSKICYRIGANLQCLFKVELILIIVPKINYLSYMLPLALPLSLLKEYNKNVESYIWQGKKPLFNRTKLYSAKSSGGLSLPRVDWYHWSFSLSQWTKINMAPNVAPTWVHIEQELLAPFPTEAFLTQFAPTST
uniref:Reverse transcriptase domain-containing protein n=1 Tax=Sinocyclocheilus anshuiensis TaxID=1608454 RepID=A0A671KAJ5_9TELE